MARSAGLLGACVVAVALCPAAPASADEIRDMQWHLPYLKVAQAHRISTGAGVTVAVVDSGIFPHRDLTGNVRKGADMGPGGDGTGRVDTDGHGTRMAGIIAGRGHGSGQGVLGIAPGAKLLPIKDSDERDNGRSVADGVAWATRAGADVINLSVVVPDSRIIRDTVQAAIAADIVVVAGAGNTDKNLKLGYPAALPGVLAVGATDRRGKRAPISVSGPEMGICAPGAEIVTTGINNRYQRATGTSDAAAVVSGAAALVRAKFPNLSAAEVVHRLTATADDNGPPGKDEECGFGVLNIVKALTADVPPLPAAAAPSVSASAVGKPAESAVQLEETASAGAVPAPKSSGSGLLLAGGIGAAVVAAGAVVALALARRRRAGA